MKTLLEVRLDKVRRRRAGETAWTEETLPQVVRGDGVAAKVASSSSYRLSEVGGDGDLEEFPSAAVFNGEVEGFGVAAEGQGQGLQVPGFGSSDLSDVFYVVGVTNEEDARSIEVAAGLFGSKERGGFAIR